MKLVEWIYENWGIENHIQYRIFYSVLVFLLIGMIRYILLRVVNKKIQDVKFKYYWQNAIKYSASILGIILIVAIWLNEIKSLALTLGLLSAGLAVALRDPIVNMAGWLFIPKQVVSRYT